MFAMEHDHMASIPPGNQLVLVIHHEPSTRHRLVSLLDSHGYAAVDAADSRSGLHKLVELHPSLVVVSAALTDTNGVQLCQRIRQCGPIPLVLVVEEEELTSATQSAACADVPLRWPQQSNRLLAMVQTLLEPSPAYKEAVERGEAIVLDQHQCQVFVSGAPVKLTNYEYRLLAFFLHNRGCVLTAKQILDHVWGRDLGEHTRSLHTYVWRLRHKIEADPQHPNFLLNEYGIGYRFTCN